MKQLIQKTTIYILCIALIIGNVSVVSAANRQGSACGNPSYYEYDAMNRLVKATLYRATAVQIAGYEYCTDDYLLIDANGAEEQVTEYEYDARGLLTKSINAAGNEKTYKYDLSGNVKSILDEDGYETLYEFNSRNQIASVMYDDGREVVYSYDDGGRLTEIEDWTGTTTFELDMLNRITSVNDHNGRITAYEYDDALKQITMIYPGNTAEVVYAYDEINRLTSVTDRINDMTIGYGKFNGKSNGKVYADDK